MVRGDVDHLGHDQRVRPGTWGCHVPDVRGQQYRRRTHHGRDPRGGRGQVPRRTRLGHHRGHPGRDLDVRRRGQPTLDAHLVPAADRLLGQLPDVPGRLRQPDRPRHQGGDLAVQRPGQPTMEDQLRRHHHRSPVRTLPGRHRSLHRQRGPGRTVDVQRAGQPAVEPELRPTERP
ncbi:hypothetical protein SGPA1_10225 [Streptomyces misionensis JCM 4497]